jgi:Spermine/spermidine synthase domain
MNGKIEERYWITGVRTRIFLVSFTLLFFELLCIRWIPAYVRYLSYFTNFILLASFLGMGLGILAARRTTFRFPPFPLLVVALVVVVALNRFELNISSTDVLYFGSGTTGVARAESFILLPLIFTFVAAAFIPLARSLGLLFTKTEPLTAYTFDILGSLAGTAAFFLIGFFSLPPVIWFGALGALILVLDCRASVSDAIRRGWRFTETPYKKEGNRQLIRSALLMIAAAGIALFLQRGTYWSPYYKITLTPAQPIGYELDVNSIGHQSMIPWQSKEPFYRRVYELFPDAKFKHALILGAGTGSDTATALAHDVQQITAVEIDPVIQELGVALHPDRPYSDPRVRLVNNDGRVFLRHTKEKYDLIIFALPDSLTLTSSIANLRLESFLFTQDSLNAAKAALAPDGVLVLYNYYREPWLIEKLAGMVSRTFGRESFVSTYGGEGRGAVLINGPRLETSAAAKAGPYREKATTGATRSLVTGEGTMGTTSIPPATDDWPFVYLPHPSFPSLYLRGLAVVAAISLAGIWWIAPRDVLRRFDWKMFFLGAAFALLEVKALITFALLFGSTWIVNSLVFFAILASVLVAVRVNTLFRVRRIGIFYLLLFAMLALNLLVRPETLLFVNVFARYFTASLLTFAPVFLANVIFSHAFSDTETADIAFASNLLGIMTGGMLEYLSMLLGYHALLWLVIAFYAVAMVLRAGATAESSRQL